MAIREREKLTKSALVLLILGVLSSCGGGGGGSTTTPPRVDISSNDWDSMVWDQDDWG